MYSHSPRCMGMIMSLSVFIHEPVAGAQVTTMTLDDDAEHFCRRERKKIIASYPDHERETRIRGVPGVGSGTVFLVDEEKLLVDPFRLSAPLGEAWAVGPRLEPSCCVRGDVVGSGFGFHLSGPHPSTAAQTPLQHVDTVRIGAYGGHGRTTAGNRHSQARAWHWCGSIPMLDWT